MLESRVLDRTVMCRSRSEASETVSKIVQITLDNAPIYHYICAGFDRSLPHVGAKLTALSFRTVSVWLSS